MLGGARELETRLVGSSYEVWPLTKCPIQDGQRFWRMGIRLGPDTSRGGANFLLSVESTPPALGGVGVHENSDALSAPGQVGYRPAVSTDANFGFCSMGPRSSKVALAQCDVRGRGSVRVAGQTSKGRQGNKKDLARGAKVGCCPLYATATNVVRPPSFALGVGGPLKAQDVHH